MPSQPSPDQKGKQDRQSRPECDPADAPGPTREAGGTTGAGNLSRDGANRTGGATSGTPRASSAVPDNPIPPNP